MSAQADRQTDRKSCVRNHEGGPCIHLSRAQGADCCLLCSLCGGQAAPVPPTPRSNSTGTHTAYLLQDAAQLARLAGREHNNGAALVAGTACAATAMQKALAVLYVESRGREGGKREAGGGAQRRTEGTQAGMAWWRLGYEGCGAWAMRAVAQSKHGNSSAALTVLCQD